MKEKMDPLFPTNPSFQSWELNDENCKLKLGFEKLSSMKHV